MATFCQYGYAIYLLLKNIVIVLLAKIESRNFHYLLSLHNQCHWDADARNTTSIEWALNKHIKSEEDHPLQNKQRHLCCLLLRFFGNRCFGYFHYYTTNKNVFFFLKCLILSKIAINRFETKEISSNWFIYFFNFYSLKLT